MVYSACAEWPLTGVINVEAIDWSKAPEGATHCNAEQTPHWYKKRGPSWLYYSVSGVWMRGAPEVVSSGFYSRLSVSPSAPSWSGEGLPPVGLAVEAYWPKDTNPNWIPFTLLYSSGNHVIAATTIGELHYTTATFKRENPTFRPIRTQDQVAADEREAAISALVEEMKAKRYALEDTDVSPSEIARHYAQAIYDAGLYRKP